ncbi:hypothetical protein [Novosphingobium sp. BW1]|uniref:hypothetical protein n=1 Tax=Novosphingobium sp. BW1 TaxID=2592621 RepID=UPI0011DEBE13|nr:hypothetical protein [Novosphingobium sp. BW1]TYC78787.1 hypothetical protein FMM79_20795 [Novosphingobium sp. BW1]
MMSNFSRLDYRHFLEIPITLTVDSPLLTANCAIAIVLRRVSNTHFCNSAFRLALTRAPYLGIEHRSPCSAILQGRPTSGTMRWLCVVDIGADDRVAQVTFADSEAAHFSVLPMAGLYARIFDGECPERP